MLALDPVRLTRLAAATGLALACSLSAASAEAFCGFYVSRAGESLHNDATAVSLMRKDQATVMAMENKYIGPPENFAMVVPVPEVLEKRQVKTLEDGVFDRLKKQTAPRLVEYWEQDPCPEPVRRRRRSAAGGVPSAPQLEASTSVDDDLKKKVTVEAKFSVGEYDIVVLSSEESNALESWLTQNNYQIPEGSAKYFRPYIQRGSYFFVAKVNVDKLEFSDNSARLSPLRFHYESKDFRLPIRLGLINSNGQQDLLTFLIGKGQRYEVANRQNVQIPTNFVVDESVEGSFGSFYNSLFDRVVDQYEDPVVTEYSWRAGKCDPCPVRPMNASDFQTLGGDVIHKVGQSSGKSELKPEKLEVDSEAVDADTLAGRLRRYRRRAQYCARRHGRRKSIERGNIVLEFEIGPSGRVRSMEILEDDFGGAANCVGAQLFSQNFSGALTMSTRSMVTVTKTYRFENIQRRRRARGPRGWTLTRLHYRYDKDRGGKDLVFEKAPAISGGRGTPSGLPSEGVSFRQPRRVTRNQFQGRYMILHPWEGELDCKNPRRGRWGRRHGRRSIQTGSGRPTSKKTNQSLDDLVVDGELPSSD